MKKAIKWFVIFSTSLIFLYAFSSSYKLQNIDNLDYVIALGIDSIPNSTNMAVSFEFANLGSFSENSSSKDTSPIINTVEAPSISSAINLMNSYVGKQLNLSHCKVIVFSSEYAKNGIFDEVSIIMHNTQIRPTTNIVIAEDNAHNYIKNSVSSLEEVLTKYYDVFPTSSKYTGYTSDIPLGTFYENMINKHVGTVSILGKKSKVSTKSQNTSNEGTESSKDSSSKQERKSDEDSSSKQETSSSNKIETSPSEEISKKDFIMENNSILEGDRGTVNIGLAVFKDDIFIGTLTAEETLWYSLLKNEVDRFLVSIDNPYNENDKIEISLSCLSSVYFDVNVDSDRPKINIKFNLNGKILNNTDQMSIYKENTRINTDLKKYLESNILNYLYKTSKEYNSDIENFYKVAKKEFLILSDLENYNWKEKYKNAEFNIEFNDTIITNLLIE